MAQIGHGYGSEYQLLRFLGHHRNLLESSIRKEENISPKKPFNWLDFRFAKSSKSISGDREITGIRFLKNIKQFNLKEEKFKEYPKGFEARQSWDSILIVNDTLYFIEAKAHKNELKGGCHAKNTSGILQFMKDSMLAVGFRDVSNMWLQDYYQLANRLSTIAYLQSKGIKAKVLYIYFENGYYDRNTDVDLGIDEEEFKEAINIEKRTLGIQNFKGLTSLLSEVFIDARTKKCII